ncbi:MAG: hypothetical protein ACM37Z_22285, partial [Deltaproteobacteria bacterium]
MESWSDGVMVERAQYSNSLVLQRSNLMMLAMTEGTQESGLTGDLKLIAGLKVKCAEPMARYTSMKIGGPADYFIEVETEHAL